MICLPETADELLVADVAIAVHIVVAHKSLQLDFLREDSIIIASRKLQIKTLINLSRLISRVFVLPPELRRA